MQKYKKKHTKLQKKYGLKLDYFAAENIIKIMVF